MIVHGHRPEGWRRRGSFEIFALCQGQGISNIIEAIYVTRSEVNNTRPERFLVRGGLVQMRKSFPENCVNGFFQGKLPLFSEALQLCRNIGFKGQRCPHESEHKKIDVLMSRSPVRAESSTNRCHPAVVHKLDLHSDGLGWFCWIEEPLTGCCSGANSPRKTLLLPVWRAGSVFGLKRAGGGGGT